MAVFAGTLHGGTLPPSKKRAQNSTNEIIASQLVPLVWERLSRRESITVLDLGIGTFQALNFYSSRDCRVYFADMGEELSTSSDEDGQLSNSFVGSEKFDVCFCWDFLNEMPSDELSIFSKNLLRYCTRQTFIHVFVAHTSVVPLRMKKYSIKSPTELIWRNANSEKPVARPRTHSDLIRFFPNMKYNGARLLEDNRHELYGKIM